MEAPPSPCHPDRSEAKRRDLRFYGPSWRCFFREPTQAENPSCAVGSAVSFGPDSDSKTRRHQTLASKQSNLILGDQILLKVINKLPRQKANRSANLDSYV